MFEVRWGGNLAKGQNFSFGIINDKVRTGGLFLLLDFPRSSSV